MNNKEQSMWEKENSHPMHIIMPIIIVIGAFALVFGALKESHSNRDNYIKSEQDLYVSWSIIHKDTVLEFADWKRLYEANLLK